MIEELDFYKQQCLILSKKIQAYELGDDKRVRLLILSINNESKLTNNLKRMYTSLDGLKKENRTLQNEKSFFQQAEFDSRLKLLE